MNKQLRRVMAVGFVVLGIGITVTYGQEQPEKELGWNLSAHAYTFKEFTFFEAMEKAQSAGLKSMELFNGQAIGGGMEGKVSYKMSADARAALKSELEKRGMEAHAIGVVSGNTEEEWKQLFEFAKAMGLDVINSEPKPEFMPLVGQLANEYQIKVGIHNHPKPSHYWDPEVVLAAVKAAKSDYVGACADIGHWVRSGLDPVACLKQYEGHLVSMHFKDLSEKSRDAHDVHWATGVCNVPGVIYELKRQGFKGNISAEYEYNWEDNAGDVKVSVANFRELLMGDSLTGN